MPWDDAAAWIQPDAMLVEPLSLVPYVQDILSPLGPSIFELWAECSLLVGRQMLPGLVTVVVIAPGLEDLQDDLYCEGLPCLWVQAGLLAPSCA